MYCCVCVCVTVCVCVVVSLSDCVGLFVRFVELFTDFFVSCEFV